MHRTFEHTADIGLEATHPTLAGLFQEAGKGLIKIMTGGAKVDARETRRVVRTHPDLRRLLLDYLDEFVFLQDAEGLVFCDLRDVQIDGSHETGWHVTATIDGEPFDRNRHHGCVHVKAITLHEFGLLLPTEDKDGAVRVILDV